MASLSVGGAIALGLSLTYIAASICAFAFPSLLHKRRRPPQCPVKFGSHRGTIRLRPVVPALLFSPFFRLHKRFESFIPIPPMCLCAALHELAGGAYERPENTIMAFQHALDVGSDLLELDCFLTADGMARALFLQCARARPVYCIHI